MSRSGVPGQRLLCCAVMVLVVAIPVTAQPAHRGAVSPVPADSVWINTVLATQGRGPSHREWIAAGVLFTTALAFDPDLESIGLSEHQSAQGLSRMANRVGRPIYFASALAGTYAVGRLLRHDGLQTGVIHASEALLVSGVVNGVGKGLFGRLRPNQEGAGGYDFQPVRIGENAWQSLPSGHAMIAFSLATSLAEEVHSPLVTTVGYLVAGTVAWSRVYDNKHWMSDVIAGAAIGTFVTRYTIRTLHAREDGGSGPTVSILPRGLAISFSTR